MDKITFNFENRTAVITGGAQGFGFDIARRFLNSGAKVIIWDNDPDTLKKSVKELNNANLTSNVVDVSKFEEVENCTNEILKNSKIDILINNAGITGPTAPLWEYDLEMWKKVIDIKCSNVTNKNRDVVRRFKNVIFITKAPIIKEALSCRKKNQTILLTLGAFCPSIRSLFFKKMTPKSEKSSKS